MTIQQGRVALITGSGKGIGRGIALEYAKHGVRVVVCDIDKVAAESVVEEIEAAGGEAIAVLGNVAKKEDCAAMVQAAMDKWGRLDILVNNAGIIRDAQLHKMTEEQWDEVLNVDLKGAFLCTQAAIEPMKKQKYGRIINISSGAYRGNFGQANYSSAKAGVVALTNVTAWEMARYNITVNCIAPGLIKTPLSTSLPEEVWARLEKCIPLGRIGTIDDINHIVLALTAEEASYITGQVIDIDGGAGVGCRYILAQG